MDPKFTTLQERTLEVGSQEVTLFDQVIFGDGEEGKRLWEAGIVLSRFLMTNPELVAGKRILEVGSGCGIAGISAYRFTKAESVILTDHCPSVMELLQQNIEVNLKTDEDEPLTEISTFLEGALRAQPTRIESKKLDWTQYETDLEDFETTEFDIVIGSDLIYQGSPFDKLADLLSHLNSSNPLTVLICMPEKRGCTDDFIEEMKRVGFSSKRYPIPIELSAKGVLRDKKESTRLYPGLDEAIPYNIFFFHN